MTKKNALMSAISALRTYDENTFSETIATLCAMVDQLSAPRHMSDEAKAKANAKRKEATAAARAEMVKVVMPILRKAITADMTAKEIFEVAKDELPEGFSANKVQNILLREMASELVKTEAKGKANTYRLA